MHLTRAASIVLVAALCSACTSASAERFSVKEGDDGPLPVVVFTPDGSGPGPEGRPSMAGDFIAALGPASGGRITASVDKSYSDTSHVDGEQDLVRAMAAGQVDVGVIPTRALRAAGIEGLDVLEAPFTIASLGAQRAVVTSPVADELLTRFDGTGLHALALGMGSLRRAVVRGAALTDLEAWNGLRVRVQAPVQEATVRALGAVPFKERIMWSEAIDAGALDAAESDVDNMVDRGIGYGYVVDANVVLWPKLFVVVTSQKFWDGLSDNERSWFEAAARQARDTGAAASRSDADAVDALCKAGVRFAMSAPSELSAMKAAVTPVLGAFEGDPVYGEIVKLAQAHPAEPLNVDPKCVSSVPAVYQPPPPSTGKPLPPFPEGTFRVEISEPEVFAYGDSNDMGWSGKWTLTIEGDHFSLSCLPTTGSIHDCGNAGATADGGPFEVGKVVPLADGYEFQYSSKEMAALGRCTLASDTQQPEGSWELPQGICPTDPTYRVGPATLTGDMLVVQSYSDDNLTFVIKPLKKIG